MKSTGIVRQMDKLGRIAIPHELRQILRFNEREKVDIFAENGQITLKKFRPVGACLVTGEILPVNKQYAPGIILSPKGAEILLEQLAKSAISKTLT